MFKLKNQFKIISFCLFVLLGMLFINNNKKIYAFPGINLNVRKQQLVEEIKNLALNSTNIFNYTNLAFQTRFNRMSEISKEINILMNDLESINQQIFIRNQYNLQRQINQNQSINHRRR